MKLVSACVALLLQSAVASPTPQTQTLRATIEGVVENHNGQPLPGAQVTLTGAAGPPGPGRASIPAVTTDRTGAFRFPNLEAGTYKVVASSNGYARTEFGQRREDTPGAPIAVKDGETVQGIAIRLIPTGNVNGYVRRPNGRAAPGVSIHLVRRNWDSSGRMSFLSAATVRSDDRGAYRFYWVAPGRYHVVAGSPPVGSIASFESRNGNEIVENYPFTFFPGSADFEKAVAIDVKSGAELDGIDFALTPSPPLRVHARIIDPKTGKPPVQAIGTISYWSPNGGGGMSGGDAYDAQTGVLQFPRLPPGIFDVSISAYDGPGIPNSAMNRAGPGASAGTRVAVTDHDVDLGVLTLDPPVVISGQVRFEGASPDAAVRNDIQIVLTFPPDGTRSATQPFLRPIQVRVPPDGTLTANFPYNSLRVSVTGLPAGYYIREAKLDGADALTSFARVTPSSTLEVVLNFTSGQISGVVRDAQSRSLVGVPAVLVPQIERSRPELFKQAITDQNGRFNLTGIAPGEYKLFAWERLAPFSYFDPDVLREYEQKGTPILITEISREAVELRVIPTN
jgi:hypothetical protein